MVGIGVYLRRIFHTEGTVQKREIFQSLPRSIKNKFWGKIKKKRGFYVFSKALWDVGSSIF